MSAYRINTPVTVEMQKQGRYRLTELPSGSMLLCANSEPDRNRMIDGTYNGVSVLLFARDLEYDAEKMDVDPKTMPDELSFRDGSTDGQHRNIVGKPATGFMLFQCIVDPVQQVGGGGG